MAIQTLNPATGEVVKEFKEITDQELEQKLALAENAFKVWRKTTFKERADLMMKLGTYLVENKEKLGSLQTLEMGKTISSSETSAAKCGLVCEYYAENAEKMLSDEAVVTDDSEAYVAFDPLGIVLAVMPWNFPLWQVYRFAAPALMAGNVALLKHASNVPQCALAIEESFKAVGFPDGVFQTLLVSSERTERIIRDNRVKAVTLTGSEKAGASVASIAASEIKKAVLELGGSDPFVVFADADLESTVKQAVSARLQNNTGQSCISAKRFIVAESIVEKFTKGVVEEISKLKVGDPSDRSVDVGPLATEQILKEIEKQVQESVALGAKLEVGGKRIGDVGYFYAPTVLTNVKKGMPVYDQETFGPVLAIISFDDSKEDRGFEEAVSISNDTEFGLGASVWTKDMVLAKKATREIDAGSVFVNTPVKSDPRLPFGGIKRSGYGRELSSYGIREFVNIKSVRIK
ncbi:MAG: succinate-semialdehyde dehydrogenase (NADP+) [Candidatus Doudnabacteria bacterium Gr01-1014_77]|uniref:Succinate-semialdehyde dehydrogenase (NADP+) n=1 Tax=Candidatus Doudnabacteria bacterium Gr01-1014_77 TaxID=2017133 RepID=A0A554JBF8_9BACT|nr:MAG: succinate-semialdehyde dehydrogenase (NADP+) [Candidatus Doudnabacteria bacterium Gr01-1014_77]